MTLDDLIAGVTIIRIHYRGNEHLIQAEHDGLFIGVGDKLPLTAAESQTMEETGWFFDEVEGAWIHFT